MSRCAMFRAAWIGPLMSPVKVGGGMRRPRGIRKSLSFDDRATLGAEPRDVGQSSHSRVRAYPYIRLGLSRSEDGRRSGDRPHRTIGNSPAAAPLPPLHEICLHRTMPRRRLPDGWSCGAAAARFPRRSALLCRGRGDLATDGCRLRKAAPSEQTGYRSWSEDHIRVGIRTSSSRSSTHDAPIVNPLDASHIRW